MESIFPESLSTVTSGEPRPIGIYDYGSLEVMSNIPIHTGENGHFLVCSPFSTPGQVGSSSLQVSTDVTCRTPVLSPQGCAGYGPALVEPWELCGSSCLCFRFLSLWLGEEWMPLPMTKLPPPSFLFFSCHFADVYSFCDCCLCGLHPRGHYACVCHVCLGLLGMWKGK